MPKNLAQNQIRKRIEHNGDPTKLEKLCLDEIQIQQFTINIKKLLQGCISLQYLTLNSCKLTSLLNFPTLPNLITLQLGNNNLHDHDIEKLLSLRQISFIDLSENKIQTIETLKKLQVLKELQILILYNNPVVQIQNYRQTIFDMLLTLNTLDNYDRNNNFVSCDDLDSYITDKYRSFRNIEDIIPIEELQAINQASASNVQIIEQNIYMPNSLDSITSKASKQQDFNKTKKRRYEKFNDSDDQQSNQMIKQFKRKIQKEM